jgi:hypothetical protein
LSNTVLSIGQNGEKKKEERQENRGTKGNGRKEEI